MKRLFSLKPVVLGFIVLIALIAAPSVGAEPSGTVVIFHAGSLSMP